MNCDLKGKGALVTGGSQGIGKAIAAGLLRAGAKVMVTARTKAKVDATVKELSELGSSVFGEPSDVSDSTAVQGLMNKALDKLEAIDILVNNAGVLKDGLVARMSEADWDSVIAINLRSAFLLTKAVCRGMIKKRWGRIINISSISGIKGNAGQANYAASKAGLIGFTKSCALELGSRGITVNAIAPGYIETAMTDNIKEASRSELTKRIPARRLGTSEDIAGLCVFLSTDNASYITGQVIGVDGGLGIA